MTEEDCFSVFPLESLVYLTPDSERGKYLSCPPDFMDDFVPRFLFHHSHGTLVVTPSKRTGEGELGDGQIPSAVKVSSISSWTLCVCLYIYLKVFSIYGYILHYRLTHREYPLSHVIFTLASIRLVVVLSFPHISLQFWSRFLSNIVSI